MLNRQRKRAAKEAAREHRHDVVDAAVERIEARGGRRPREVRVRARTGAQKRRGRVGRLQTP